MKSPLLIITGPTAVGKTTLSLELAKKLQGEIISADSMQVYRGMDIGTAKEPPENRRGIPHYLIDILDPQENFDVVRFQTLAKEAIGKIQEKGKLPILVGGTGFYIQSLLYDIHFEPEEEKGEYRKILEKQLEEHGPQWLHQQLKLVDSSSFVAIPPENTKRVIRALEFYHENGYPISIHNARERERESAYDSLYLVLTLERSLLYQRINLRVEEMFQKGLEEEARALFLGPKPLSATARQGIGYKEWIPYFQGECSKEEVKEKIKQDTRHFAKRQFTWFQREKQVVFLDANPPKTSGELLEEAEEKWRDISNGTHHSL